MSSYVNPQLRDKLESLPIELKNDILSRGRRLDTMDDLNAVLEDIVSGKEAWEERVPDISNVVSSMECTGLMPTIPADEAEFTSYQQLYDMEIPKKVNIPPESV